MEPTVSAGRDKRKWRPRPAQSAATGGRGHPAIQGWARRAKVRSPPPATKERTATTAPARVSPGKVAVVAAEPRSAASMQDRAPAVEARAGVAALWVGEARLAARASRS